jgi:DNA-binding response OmpR family regulator
MDASNDEPHPAALAPLALDARARRATLGSRPLHLTRLEFDLLAYLAGQAGQAVSRDELLDCVWHASRQRGGTMAQLKNCVWRLREELEPEPHHPRYLLTVRGFGYRLVLVPEPSHPDPAGGAEN